MAESMFNTDGSLSSTDPKVIQAAMRATGGQILPSSPSFKRALELAQLRDVQMQQGMAQGAQAVKNLQQYQAANPPTISGLPSNQVVTSDTGYKAVLDAQGNIVGTNVPTAPVSDTVGKFADERAAFNQGKGTMLERAALGPNIRDAFLKEYAKPDPNKAMPPMAAGAGVRAPAQTPIGPAASRLINQDYLGNAFTAAAPPPTSAGAGNSAQKSRLEQDIGLMEAQFGAQGAAPNRGQNPQGANRAELYRELQKLTEEIKSGVTSVPGEFSSDYGFSGASEIPLSPQQLTDKAQRVAEVQSAIKGSQEVVQPTDEAAIAKWLGMTKQLEGMQRPAMPPMAAGAGVRAPAVSPAAGFSKEFEEQAALDAEIRQMEAAFRQKTPTVQETAELESKKRLLATMQGGGGDVPAKPAPASNTKGDPEKLKKLKAEQAALEKKVKDMQAKTKEKEAELKKSLEDLITPKTSTKVERVYRPA